MKLFFLIFLSFFSFSAFSQWKTESFMQGVYLHKFNNAIIQGFVHTQKELSFGIPYLGVWFDQDQKTAARGVFTDSQVAPLVGVKSHLFASEIVPSRFFVELRAGLRTEDFPDHRDRFAGEGRVGLLGYDKLNLTSYLFVEHYYSLFYTHLYNSRVIFQGWSKQGISLKQIDVFNEIFIDTFDFTRGQDATMDLRPGLRWSKRSESLVVQLIHQYIHHFSNLSFSGRSEQRSTLVVGFQF